MNIQVKQRVVGAIVLVALAVIFIPLLLPGKGDVIGLIENSNVPPAPDYRFPPIKDAPEAPAMDKVVVPLDTPAGETSVAVVAPEPPATGQVSTPEAAPAPKPTPKKPPVAEVTAEPSSKEVLAAKIPQAGEVRAWTVQLGSFSSQKNALALRDTLRAKGYPSFVEALKSGGKMIYRVRVGPELTRASADKLRQKLLQEMKMQGLVKQYP